MKIFILLLTLLSFFSAGNNYPQSFGFGCLGFVGGYAGYSYQIYNPKGLNDYIMVFNTNRQDSLTAPMSDFGKARGYRLGINLFRANLEGLILTAKGFYQFLGEKHEATQQLLVGSASTTYEVEMKNWGVGLDLGTSITKALSWKVIDAALLFNTAVFTNTQNFPGAQTVVAEYETESSRLGYTIGTGFILAVIDEYITIEGVAAYTVFSIDKMKLSENEYLTVNEDSPQVMQNFIEAGGFNAVIQLNIGFPL